MIGGDALAGATDERLRHVEFSLETPTDFVHERPQLRKVYVYHG